MWSWFKIWWDRRATRALGEAKAQGDARSPGDARVRGGDTRAPGADAREIGVAGERAAEAFVRKTLGYSIIARNWRSPRDRRDEIDLVCRDREVLVFVEVKTRAAGALVGGYESVDQRKRRALQRAVRAYLRGLPEARRQHVRFDVVEVERSADGACAVRHFENALLFPRGFTP